jgi:hypothetical protein
LTTGISAIALKEKKCGQRPFMKIFRTFALLVSTVALLGLGGCASTVSQERALQLYPIGESSLYGVVFPLA